ncbi:MAG: undecaprenyl/decaprenyl-phosphate alpha-N-acetylglucosaminyl 1-phosphate transferase [Phycisphaerae bacterium]|nr:undecaprenyl/decaprenyl-phosphate alpha-N-acetylglucosaminyl 1-phosphate transferase [Phycisphaerae bacterium]
MIPYVLACLAIGFAVSCPLTGLLVRLGHRVGALDSAGSKGHVKVLRKVPNIGGVAIVWGFLAPLVAALLALSLMPDTILGLAPSAKPFAERLHSSLPTFWAIAGGAFVLHILGLVDDRRALGPFVKLGAQFGVAAVVTIVFDVQLLSALSKWFPGGEVVSVVITVLWIVLITNAMNFIDNMDGLSGGLGMIAALVLMTATIVNEQWFVSAAFALLAGSLLGFLVFNRPPAKIFMGDGGSLPLGFLLATLVARTTFVDTSDPDFALGTAWYGVFLPVAALAIPLYDIIAVSAVRLAKGKSPFVGGDEHFSHRLVHLGLSRPQAVGILWMLGAMTGISGIVLGRLPPWQAILVGMQLVLALVIVATLERAVHTARKPERTEGRSDGTR